MSRTTPSSYKINQITVEPNLNQLSSDGKTIIIEGRLMSVLLCLIERQGETVSIEELVASAWQGQVVSNSAVYRAVAELRKALVKQLGSDDVIKTVTKKGYQLNANIEGEFQPRSTGQNNKKWLGLILAALIISVFVSYFAAILFDEDKLTGWFNNRLDTPINNSHVVRVKTVTSAQGKEFTPAISQDGQFVLFSHRSEDASSINLFLQRLNNNENELISSDDLTDTKNTNSVQQTLYKITHENARYTRASWSPDGSTIVFQKATSSQCQIILARFDRIDFTLKNERVFTNCTGDVQTAISWSLDGTRLLYTSNLTGRSEVYEHSLTTQEKRRLLSPKNSESWNSFVVASPFQNKALILSFLDYRKTEFLLYDLDKQTHELLYSDSQLIDSATWGKTANEILFEKNNKRILQLNIKDKTTKVWFESGSFINGINRSADGSQYVLSSMLQAEEDILLAPIAHSKTSPQEPVSNLSWQHNSSLVEKLPEFANLSNRIVFLSNRSGNDQIWLKEEDGQIRQLTHFRGERWFGRISWSKDDSQLLFARGEIIYLLNLNDLSVQTIVSYNKKDSKVAYSPNWSPDGKSIYYSVHAKGKNYIYRQSLENLDKSEMQISDDNLRNLKESSNGRYLYFARISHFGLTRFDISTGKSQILIPNLHPSMWNSWRLTDNGIYYLDIENTVKGVHFYDFETKKTHFVFPWDRIMGAHFSISKDRTYYVRDQYVDNEASVMLLSTD